MFYILCFWVMHTSMFNGIGQDNCILFGYSDFTLQDAMIASIRGLNSEISVPPTKNGTCMDDIEWWFLEISHQQKILQGIPWYFSGSLTPPEKKSRLVELRSPGGTDWLFLGGIRVRHERIYERYVGRFARLIYGWKNSIPWWYLTYPITNHCWRLFSFSPGGICWFPGGYTEVWTHEAWVNFVVTSDSSEFFPDLLGSPKGGNR